MDIYIYIYDMYAFLVSISDQLLLRNVKKRFICNTPLHVTVYHCTSYGKMASLMIKLQTPRPLSLAWDWHLDDSVEPHLEMFLHPYCHYQLRLLASAPDSLGQVMASLSYNKMSSMSMPVQRRSRKLFICQHVSY